MSIIEYKTKLITDILTEPISLSQIKEHLKLNSGTFAEDISTEQTIVPASYSPSTQTGTGIDVLNKKALININAGDCSAGTVNIKIQESDDDLTYTDWYNFTQISASNDNQIHEKEYTGIRQYIRCIATIATGSCVFSVDIVINSYEDSEDSSLTIYQKAAREWGEDFTGFGFAPQTWEMYLDDFPNSNYINWFKPPLTSVTSVIYKDSDGTETTMTVSTEYIVDSATSPGGIFLPYGESWPSFTPYPYNAVAIKGVCGFTGTAPYIIPKSWIDAMLLHAGYMYKFRDTEIPESHIKTIKSLYGMRRKEWF